MSGPRPGATTWSTAPPTPPSPTTARHVKALEDAGAVATAATARIVGRGRVEVTPRRRGPRARRPRTSSSPSARLEGAADRRARRGPAWTNREATLTRELPRSLLVLGGGPTGCELAQVFVRFGVPVTIVQSGPRLVPTDHPRNAEASRARARARRRRPCGSACVRRARGGRRAGTAQHVIDLDDGSTAEGHVDPARRRARLPARRPGHGALRHRHSGPDAYPRDGRLRMADGLWVAATRPGPELHTHQGHYQGELAVRMALGEASGPTTAPCHGRPTWTRRRRRSA